ncbi:chlorophyllase/cutinase-like alpha/beta fold protein [Clostridium ganghwense]|uniref:Alpha/beta hydrolase n=1 Tax=Clostridium ganghwense TaxID=312089 RepID=A0ABT4CP93_9CLOT|nr:hypothetical protein [Clostridium ganghwense]MCY6370879.1 hypothetical protein [Clostridium ganghwense]
MNKRKAQNWIKSKGTCILNGFKDNIGKGWIGGKLALKVCVFILFAIVGAYINTGLGVIIDIFICGLVGFLIVNISGVLLKVLIKIFRYIPAEFMAFFLIFVIVITIVLYNVFGLAIYADLLIAFTIAVIESFLGIGIWLLLKRKSKNYLGISLVFFTIAINLSVVFLLKNSGTDNKELERYLVLHKEFVSKRAIDSPALKGKYEVKKLYYGSGKDKNRKEYAEKVNIKTKEVFAYNFLENYKGIKGKLRSKYWGFDDRKMPLNGIVWYPKGEGVFPLVLIVHGNHTMEEYSEGGYEYLGEILASQGFITVSIDENFLNSSWSGNLGNENDARAWIILKHLEQWKKFNYDNKNAFYNKVDLDNIALIGHSRGGEAVATAALFNKLKYYPLDADTTFDFNYSIKSIVAIAPTDEQYKPGDKPTQLENIDYLLLQGANDGDISTFMGSNQYNRVKFNDEKYHFKSMLYIFGANHGQFNTVWGRADLSKPLSFLLNTKQILKGEDQRRIAKIYISAFLKTTLMNEKKYISLFRDYNTAEKNLPQTLYINRFEDSNFNLIGNYEEDVDLRSTTISGGIAEGERLWEWKEGSLKLRGDFESNNNVVYLKWRNKGGRYTIDLSQNTTDKLNIHLDSKLIFSACDIDETKTKSDKFDLTDFTVKVVDSKGEEASLPLSSFNIMPPAIGIKFAKWNYYNKVQYGEEFEPVLQTYQFKMRDFINSNSRFNPKELKKIEFIFDESENGQIIIDDIGIER